MLTRIASIHRDGGGDLQDLSAGALLHLDLALASSEALWALARDVLDEDVEEILSSVLRVQASLQADVAGVARVMSESISKEDGRALSGIVGITLAEDDFRSAASCVRSRFDEMHEVVHKLSEIVLLTKARRANLVHWN